MLIILHLSVWRAGRSTKPQDESGWSYMQGFPLKRNNAKFVWLFIFVIVRYGSIALIKPTYSFIQIYAEISGNPFCFLEHF